MREIKFRAWDKDENEMYCGLDKILCEWDGFKGKLMRLFDGSQPIMQYTGLKDKGGKEIYEGDILMQELSNDLKTIHVITWIQNDNDCGFYLKRTKPNPYTSIDVGQERASKLEIIGNIYENPELLK